MNNKKERNEREKEKKGKVYVIKRVKREEKRIIDIRKENHHVNDTDV